MVVSNARKKLDFCTFRFTKLYKSFCRVYKKHEEKDVRNVVS